MYVYIYVFLYIYILCICTVYPLMTAIAAYNDEASAKLQGGTDGPRYLQQRRHASPGSRSSKELLLRGVHQLDLPFKVN